MRLRFLGGDWGGLGVYFWLPVLGRNALIFCGLWKNLQTEMNNTDKTFTQIITVHTFTLKEDEMYRQRVHGYSEH